MSSHQTDHLLKAALPQPPRRSLEKMVQEEAVKVAKRLWRDRNSGRIFKQAEMDLSTHRARQWVNERYWGKAVGIMPPMSYLQGDGGYLHTIMVVGICCGIQTDGFMGGYSMVTADFFTGACYHHRGLGLVGWIVELPEPFQAIARAALRDEEDDE